MWRVPGAGGRRPQDVRIAELQRLVRPEAPATSRRLSEPPRHAGPIGRVTSRRDAPVFAKIGPTKCTEWLMSWGLIFPPGLEPDRWCIPVCVLRAPLYVYYLYFSEK